jgi:hypothetical protein
MYKSFVFLCIKLSFNSKLNIVQFKSTHKEETLMVGMQVYEFFVNFVEVQIALRSLKSTCTNVWNHKKCSTCTRSEPELQMYIGEGVGASETLTSNSQRQTLVLRSSSVYV